MADQNQQTLIQVRVDSEMKEQAAEVFENIGIDIPTAIRMFLKASIRVQGLPFSTALQPDTIAIAQPAPITAPEVQPSEPTDAEQLMAFFKRMAIYDPTPEEADENTVVVLPLENDRDIPASMYVQLICKVPAGCITSMEDINAFLGKLYNRNVGYPDRPLPRHTADNSDIPYWRVVSERGVLGGGRGGSKAIQKDKLTAEGLTIVQRGSVKDSYKVENYKEHMFNFGILKIVRR